MFKVVLVIFVLFLLVGCQPVGEVMEDSDNVKKDVNTEDPEDEFYDGLDDALAELEELEEDI